MALSRRRVALGGAVAALLAIGVAVSPGSAIERFHGVVFGPWFPLVLAGLYLLRPLLLWPITALSALVGYRYGVAVGVPIALFGAVATSLIPYWTARAFGTDVAALDRATGGSRRFFAATGDLRGVIAARLAPTPAEAISGAAGLARVSVPAFVLGTLIGELPWTVAAVVAGNALTAFAPGAVSPDPWLVAAGALGAALLLAGPAYRIARERGVLAEV